MPDRSLLEWIQIAQEIAPHVAAIRADGKVNMDDLPAGLKILDVLNAHGVTLVEIAALGQALGPLLALILKATK